MSFQYGYFQSLLNSLTENGHHFFARCCEKVCLSLMRLQNSDRKWVEVSWLCCVCFNRIWKKWNYIRKVTSFARFWKWFKIKVILQKVCLNSFPFAFEKTHTITFFWDFDLKSASKTNLAEKDIFTKCVRLFSLPLWTLENDQMRLHQKKLFLKLT